MNIAVAGTGYVGLSLAVLLAQHNEVVAVDVIPEKVEKINKRISPIQDEYIEKYLAEKELNLVATLDGAKAYRDAELVIIAAPTNYDPKKNFFDTKYVEQVIELVLSVNQNAVMVIKSTIPVGYTKSVREKYHTENIIFSPEFLRESKALYDNLYPSRIIVGCPKGNEKVVLLHEIMEYALKEKMILSNPTNGTTIPKIDPTELMVLDEKQLKIFISAIQSNEQWRDFFYLEIMTGLRRGEICALKWSDFDIVERKLHVNRSVTPHGAIGKAKTCYSERVIKLPYSVYQVLVNRKTSAQSEWMFPQPKDLSKPITGESALRQLKVILKSSGLPNIRFHDLRHTFATHAVSAGIDPKTLSSILGHSKASFSLDRYGHVTAEMQKGAAKTIGHFFNELVGEEVDQCQKEEEDSHHNSKAEDGEQE